MRGKFNVTVHSSASAADKGIGAVALYALRAVEPVYGLLPLSWYS